MAQSPVHKTYQTSTQRVHQNQVQICQAPSGPYQNQVQIPAHVQAQIQVRGQNHVPFPGQNQIRAQVHQIPVPQIQDHQVHQTYISPPCIKSTSRPYDRLHLHYTTHAYFCQVLPLIIEKHQNNRRIIKESLGEYGSGWGWDKEMPHVFKQESGINEPMLYINSRDTTIPSLNNGNIIYGKSTSTMGGQSQFYFEYTNGETLASLSLMTNQISLKPHSYNAGNYYNFPSQLESNSNTVCAKGWGLSLSSEYSILINVYSFMETTSNKDTALLNPPFSYLRSGFYNYDGILGNREGYGFYRTLSSLLRFNISYLEPTYYAHADYGYSVRCVAR